MMNPGVSYYIIRTGAFCELMMRHVTADQDIRLMSDSYSPSMSHKEVKDHMLNTFHKRLITATKVRDA